MQERCVPAIHYASCNSKEWHDNDRSLFRIKMPAKVKHRKSHSLLGNTYKSPSHTKCKAWRARATICKKTVIGPWRRTKTQADADLATARSKPSRLEFKTALQVLVRNAGATSTASSVHVANVTAANTRRKRKACCTTKPNAKPTEGQHMQVQGELLEHHRSGMIAQTVLDRDSGLPNHEQHIESSGERRVLFVD